ncbi:MAG: tetratricopeptide repeat protein, partial [Ignavibacteriae bacterium]|nr:tetratricopeptide repeat protein [Ignavibacteriota bacterium]
ISVNDILKVTLSSYSNKNDIIVNNFFNKGMYALSEIKYSDAIKYFTRCIEINPNYADAYGRRGCAYNGLKEYYKAISDFTKAIEIQQNGSWAYFMRGHTYKDLKEYSKALSDYTKAIELQSDYGDFYYERGYLYYELKEYDNACKDWNKAKEFGVTGIRNVNSVINKYCK